MKEKVISKEDAVFWMDKDGNWRNEHGKFEHKKIIDYFNSAIGKDEKGYYVSQIIDEGVMEKVYFHTEDVALFVVDILQKRDAHITLLLNTKAKIPLLPDALQIKNDHLYMKLEDHLIKFTQRSLLKLSDKITEEDGRCYFSLGTERYLIPNLDE